jgi:hypothetical protein
VRGGLGEEHGEVVGRRAFHRQFVRLPGAFR